MELLKDECQYSSSPLAPKQTPLIFRMSEVGRKTLMGKYELGRTLGEGKFSKIKFARNLETGENVAIKIFDKERALHHMMAGQIKREISSMMLIRHPNVIRLNEVMASKSKIYAVMELATGGELSEKIAMEGGLWEDEARKYFQQLINAIEYCHNRGVYHRDLKPENLLLDSDGVLKISEFGHCALAQQVSKDGLLYATCGTPNYVAPEVVKGGGYDGAKADLWSCGVILFVLLAGYLPFEDSNLKSLHKKICKADFSGPFWFSIDAEKLIRRILDPNPHTRITIPQVIENEWFKKGYQPQSGRTDDVDLDDVNFIFNESWDIDMRKGINRKETLYTYEMSGSEAYATEVSNISFMEQSPPKLHHMPHAKKPSSLEDREEKKEKNMYPMLPIVGGSSSGGRGYETIDDIEFSQMSTLVDGSHIYGREDDMKRIVDILLSDDCNIICIVADGGIGKTSLVHLVYNDRGVFETFDTRIFVCMSGKFDEKRLLKEIIESITCNPCDITELHIIEDVVKEELMGKKLLLVLDDAENESQSFWKNVSELLNVAAKGSCVIVTTRSKIIPNIVGEKCTYYLHHLSHSCCWEFFQQVAFDGRDPNALPELVTIGKQFVSKCENNPLCIKVISGLLRNSVNENWCSILESDLWAIEQLGFDVLPALRVCYHYLPTHLKQCLTYCSLFPKNYIFSKDSFVRLWLSQGFIESKDGRELEDIGIEYFDDLLCRLFLQHSPIHIAKENKFVLSGPIHDLAMYVSSNGYFRFEEHVQTLPQENVSHFSLVPYEFQTVSLKCLNSAARDLQTLLVVRRSSLQLENIVSPIVNLVDLNDLFVKFSSLRTLNLSDTDIEELPVSIGLLRNLRFLALNNTRIKSLPFEICNLSDLQILETKDCNDLVELPENIKDLTNLRHLDVTRELGDVGFPLGIGQLTNLRTLTIFNVGCDLEYSRIGELKNLEYLRTLYISGLENIESDVDAKEANLKSKRNLETFSLQWSDSGAYVEEDEEIEIAEKVLDELQPSNNLQELIIRNYASSRFPKWVEDPSFSKLVSIVLDNCHNCSNFPALGQLPSLRYLSVQKMYGLQTLEASNCSFSMQNFNKFPSLELLNLWEMYELEELFEIGNGDFPRLHALSVNKCPLLRNIPGFPCLVELSLHYCTQLPEIPDLPSLESLKIEGFHKIKSLDLPSNLPMLRKLEVSHCNELLSVEGLSQLTSLEKLQLIQCPNLDMRTKWQPNYLKKDDEIRVGGKEKHEEALLEQHTEQLKQKIQISEIQQDEEITNEQQVATEQLVSYSKYDSDVSSGVARDSLDSLPADYDIWQEWDVAAKGIKELFDQKEHFNAALQKASFSIFTLKELEKATQNFSCLIGRGGFGNVYKGFLHETTVAIKIRRPSDSHGKREFLQEVKILSTVKHPNIVTLLGVCLEPLALVFEFLPNGSLEDRLCCKNFPPLTWQDRTRIIGEICSILISLHSNKPNLIVYRDLKPSNILFDANLMIKFVDFGISRLQEETECSTMVMGSVGYLDPEYFHTQRLTPQSDVYAFGIIILRLLTGKPPLQIENKFGGPMTIVQYVEEAMKKDELELIIDISAGDWPFEHAENLVKLGLRCSSVQRRMRPDLVNEVWTAIDPLMKAAAVSVMPVIQPLKKVDSLFMTQLNELMETQNFTASSKSFKTKVLKFFRLDKLLKKIKRKKIQEQKVTSEKALFSYSKNATDDLEVISRASIDSLESLQTYKYNTQLYQEGDSATKEPEELFDRTEGEDFIVELNRALISIFSLQELKEATLDFNDSLKIGQGGFGPVYRGFLNNTAVAIKVLSSQSKHGLSQFQQEVTILSRVRHRNLVSLIGVCLESGGLVYEFLPNGSLEDRLVRKNNTEPLTWQVRTRIIGEICSALIFLHSNNPHFVIHGDLKPSNILLDVNLVSKLSDFGISHLLMEPAENTTAFFYYTKPKGTFAYMDPEYVTTGKLTAQSDTYSFGIVVLRLLTGKPPLGIARIVEEAMTDDNLQSLIDTSAGDWPFKHSKRLADLGLRCADLRRKRRPDLVSEVWAVLEPLIDC